MNIVIIEDEATVAQRLVRFLSEILSNEHFQIKQFEYLFEGIDYLKSNPVDLVILDLNLNGEDGFEMFQHMNSYAFHIIIVSAYTNRAVEAFEYGVLDFVPKPFDKARLKKAMDKLVSDRNEQSAYLKKLAIRKRDRFQLIDVDDVLYIQGAGIYSKLHLHSGKTVLHDKSLDRIIKLLPPRFERIHKSYIVDMAQVEEIIFSSGSKYEISTKSQQVLPVGRTRYKELKDKWIFKQSKSG